MTALEIIGMILLLFLLLSLLRVGVIVDFGGELRVRDLFAILFTLAVPVGKWFLRWRRAHGGEAKAEPPAERAAVPKTNEPEKRTA